MGVLAHGENESISASWRGKLTVRSTTNGCDGYIRFRHSSGLVLHNRDGGEFWTEGGSKWEGDGLGDLRSRQCE